MRTDAPRFRWLATRLPAPPTRRLVLLTGARQTGKTTLARATWPGLSYLDLEDLDVRAALRATRTSQWPDRVGAAILDEAQKEPSVLEKVKFALDFTVLLGSSRILLQRVRETLAGRASLY